MDNRTKTEMILENKIKCLKCGDIIESVYQHDFKTCSCGACSVDGGKYYLRRVGNDKDFEELSVTGIFIAPKEEDNGRKDS